MTVLAVACGGAVDNHESDRQKDGFSQCADCEDEAAASGGGSTNPTYGSGGASAGAAPSTGTGGSTAPSGPGDSPPDPLDPLPNPNESRNPPRIPTPRAGGIALRHGDFPSLPSGGSGGSGSSGEGPESDPDRVFVVLGSHAPRCEAPFEYAGCGHWKVGFNLPAELLKPGVIELSDPRLAAYSSVSGPDRGGGDCWGGGGSFLAGTVEIQSVDEAFIVLRLEGTSTVDFDANGEHIIERCY